MDIATTITIGINENTENVFSIANTLAIAHELCFRVVKRHSKTECLPDIQDDSIPDSVTDYTITFMGAADDIAKFESAFHDGDAAFPLESQTVCEYLNGLSID